MVAPLDDKSALAPGATLTPRAMLAPSAALDELWQIAMRHRAISPSRLMEVLPIAADAELDPRSQLLIRDSVVALEGRLGDRARRTLESTPNYRKLRAIVDADYDKVGFRTIQGRLMEPTKPDQIRRFFRELGKHVRRPATMYVAGSAVLILHELIVKRTDDIDAVDEIPAELREQHDLLHRLAEEDNLQLAHTASHYYPAGWKRRAGYLDQYGELTVYLLDPIDQLVGKLFSRRPKDFVDIKDAWDHIDQTAFRERLVRCTRQLRAVPSLGTIVEEHWYVLTGEKTLPPLADDAE